MYGVEEGEGESVDQHLCEDPAADGFKMGVCLEQVDLLKEIGGQS